MPGKVLNFTSGELTPTDLSDIRLNLRHGPSLMLWAGDCVHNGVPDVIRLTNYEVFVCKGYDFDGSLGENIEALGADQVLCILDVNNEQQMCDFRYVFRERFRKISSDYHGNTPSLPLMEYINLLEHDGIARHVFGIGGLILPYEDFYKVLETFAPVLTSKWKDQRQWSQQILELAKRDSLSPGMVWTDPDINHPYYANVKEAQLRFSVMQQKRNPLWPGHGQTLEEHWYSMPITSLCVPSYLHITNGPELMEELEQYFAALSTHLSQRMQQHPQFNMVNAESLEGTYANMTQMEVIRQKLRILGLLSTTIPPGLHGRIELFVDDRRDNCPTLFDLTLIKT